jgi:carbon monoxide dehydrogenase subunit G
MKYSSEISIAVPRKRLIELFDNTENLSKWMKGLKSFETLEGEHGEVGATARMKFEMGKRKVDMLETILESNFPHSFKAAYQATGVYNEVNNVFEDKGDHTLYTTEHYFKFNSWMMRFMGFLMPNAFKKQSMVYLKDFKAFAEGAT